MRFYKQFTDNHRGQSTQSLLDEAGYFGPFCRDTIYQMCAEKLEKPRGREFTEDDFTFTFHERLVRSTLRANSKRLLNGLQVLEKCNLLSFRVVGKYIEFKIPILLTLLDRDMKNPRRHRGTSAERARLELELELELELDKQSAPSCRAPNAQMHKPVGLSAIEFEALYKKYPRKQGKSRGLKKFKAQIKDENDYQQINQAVERFVEHLKRNATEAKFIPHFDTFMGEWRDWLDPMNGTSEKLSAQKRTIGVVRE